MQFKLADYPIMAMKGGAVGRNRQCPRTILRLTVLVLLSGCGHHPPLQPSPRIVAKSVDVANVFVTALPPMAFSDIQGSLAIQQGLSAADCRTLAAQTTGSNVYQLLSQTALGVGLALPQRSVSNSATTTNSGTTT